MIVKYLTSDECGLITSNVPIKLEINEQIYGTKKRHRLFDDSLMVGVQKNFQYLCNGRHQ
jgi:hypothetical protein